MSVMMLPAVVPLLWRFSRADQRATATQRVRLAVVFYIGYLVVWAAVGVVIFPIGALLTALAMREPSAASLRAVAAGGGKGRGPGALGQEAGRAGHRD